MSMTEMKVHCPGCGKALRVPETASGRKARCPQCRRVFLIPHPDELFDETISTWIEEDVEKLEQQHDKQWEEIASIRAYRRREQAEEAAAKRKAEAEATSAKSKDNGRNEAGAATAQAEAPAAEPPSDAPKPSGDTAATASQPSVGGESSIIAAKPARSAAAPVASRATRESQSAPRRGGRSAQELGSYPNDLCVDPDKPHLVVVECNQSGVTFAFDSVHLQHDGFRTSMPVRCAMSGESDRRRLFARPLAFIDQSSAKVRNPQEIEDKHTTHLASHQTPYDLLPVMGEISVLPKPFNLPMPYYVAHEFGHLSVKCWTQTRSDTGITCLVRIPDGETALQWLANVNGITGAEYALMENDVALMSNDAWRELSDNCRQRLNVWCPFEPSEQFRLYVSDGDFGKKDEGLAGIVLTDTRLIYCKYHHRGTASLSEPTTIYIKPEGDFATLSMENSEGRTKLVKVRKTDIGTLIESLEAYPDVRVEEKQPATS